MHCDEWRILTLNGQEVHSEEDRDLLIDWVYSSFVVVEECPFCHRILNRVQKSELLDADEEWIEKIAVAECPWCAYWQAEWYEDLGQGLLGGPTNEWEVQISKIREFEDVLPSGCEAELARCLRVNPDHWHHFHPRRLEELVADIFKANYTSAEVIHVGKTGDGGVDVILVNTVNQTWLIQVKRRKSLNASEGPDVIRNLLGVMCLKGKKFGVVVSTVDHFTSAALAERNLASQRGMTIELIDKWKLDLMVGPLLPTPEWWHLVSERKPEWQEHFREKIPNPKQLRFWDDIK